MAQKLIKNQDIAIILETGSNNGNPIRDVLNNHTTTTYNNMKDIQEGKEQYQHCGSGTAIIQKKGLR